MPGCYLHLKKFNVSNYWLLNDFMSKCSTQFFESLTEKYCSASSWSWSSRIWPSFPLYCLWRNKKGKHVKTQLLTNDKDKLFLTRTASYEDLIVAHTLLHKEQVCCILKFWFNYFLYSSLMILSVCNLEGKKSSKWRNVKSAEGRDDRNLINEKYLQSA